MSSVTENKKLRDNQVFIRNLAFDVTNEVGINVLNSTYYLDIILIVGLIENF